MVTFVCWLWKGFRPVYTAAHVNRLHAMLAKHMTGPWKLVCITDDERGIDCEVFPLWTLPRAKIPHRTDVGKKIVPDCFTRLRMFEPNVGRLFGERIVSVDLDCTILADLAPLFDNDSDFKASRGYRSHICGSMWQLRAGTHAHVWQHYDPIKSPKIIAAATHTDDKNRIWPLSGSDQAWMSLRMPHAPLWTEADGVYQFMEMKPQRNVPANARVVFFAGRIKPWDLECRWMCPTLYTPV